MQPGKKIENAVINSTPIISLFIINKLELLKELFKKIFIPKAVYNEIVRNRAKKPGYRELHNLDWIKTGEIKNTNLKESIMLELDEGEAEVITYAKENNIQTVIIDEFAGRKYAALMDLHVIGTLGILLAAKKINKIKQVKPLLDILISRKRYISKNLYFQILKAAEEK